MWSQVPRNASSDRSHSDLVVPGLHGRGHGDIEHRDLELNPPNWSWLGCGCGIGREGNLGELGWELLPARVC